MKPYIFSSSRVEGELCNNTDIAVNFWPLLMKYPDWLTNALSRPISLILCYIISSCPQHYRLISLLSDSMDSFLSISFQTAAISANNVDHNNKTNFWWHCVYAALSFADPPGPCNF